MFYLKQNLYLQDKINGCHGLLGEKDGSEKGGSEALQITQGGSEDSLSERTRVDSENKKVVKKTSNGSGKNMAHIAKGGPENKRCQRSFHTSSRLGADFLGNNTYFYLLLW